MEEWGSERERTYLKHGSILKSKFVNAVFYTWDRIYFFTVTPRSHALILLVGGMTYSDWIMKLRVGHLVPQKLSAVQCKKY